VRKGLYCPVLPTNNLTLSKELGLTPVKIIDMAIMD